MVTRLVAVAFHPCRSDRLGGSADAHRRGSWVNPGSSRPIGSGNWLRFSSASKVDERLKRVRVTRQEHWELGAEALAIPSLERRQGRQNSDGGLVGIGLAVEIVMDQCRDAAQPLTHLAIPGIILRPASLD